MRRVEKEILKLDQVDISAAAKMATKAGYHVECYDGDAENGPCAPELAYYRPDSWHREVESRMMDEVRRNM